MPTAEEIEAAKTPRGGWTRAQLAEWGVPWPPPKGWRKALECGMTVGTEDELAAVSQPLTLRRDADAHGLLRQVVVAVINAGHASDLYDFPDVLAYFRGQVPEA
jgi:hypothetical protein